MEKIRQGDIPGIQIRYRHQLPGTSTEIWQWLTDTDRLTAWLCQTIDIDRDRPGIILLESTTEDGQPLHEQIEPVEADPPRRWVVNFQRLEAKWPTHTRLIFELTSNTDGTELSVLQTGFAHLPLSDCLTIWETYRRRWRTALARLAEAMAHQPNR